MREERIVRGWIGVGAGVPIGGHNLGDARDHIRDDLPLLKRAHCNSPSLAQGSYPSKIGASAHRAAILRCSGVRTVHVSSGRPTTSRTNRATGVGNALTS